jgi:hypothetical protein
MRILLPLKHDELVVIALALQCGVSELETVQDPLTVKVTEMLAQVSPGLYQQFVEQGDIAPLPGDEQFAPG